VGRARRGQRLTVHPTAADGFERGVGDYERGRPGYAPDAVEWLVRQFDAGPGTRLVDLAAGTGKLTRELLRTGAHVVAVEPVPAMRAALGESCPGAEVLDGTAETMPLPAESVDGVTVAQAFHWFDGERALAEIHRVLRAQGRLAVVWNVRELEQPVQWELERILDRYRGATPSHRSGKWRQSFASTELFRAAGNERFPHVQPLDSDGLVARVASISFIAALTAPDRERVLDEVRAIADAQGGRIDLAYHTEVFVYDRILARS
jgi:SAM-dependent methyltransferase